MYSFNALAPYVANPITIAFVVGILILWTVASATLFYNATRKLARALDRAAKLVAFAADRTEFARRYEEISQGLLSDPVLRGRWREFADSLVAPTRPAGPMRSTTRPGQWFDMSLLRSRAIGVNTRYHASLPNLLVGAGLLFTFFGLAIALGTAGGIVGGETEARNNALKALLDTASMKFTTSLAGLGLSITYSIFSKWRLQRVETALDHFLAALEERVPLVTDVSLQQEANGLLERQLTFSESLANDLSLALQQAVDQAFDHRLGEHVGPLRDALERLTEKISGSNEDAIERMLESFVSRLQGGAGDRMQDVAKSLEILGGRLEGLQSGLGDAAVRMAQSADTMAARMGEGAEAALGRVTDQMSGVVETLRGVAAETRGAGAEAGRELADRIAAAAKGFEDSSRTVAEQLAKSAAGLQTRMDTQAEASAERLNAQVERMIAQLQTLAETSRSTGDAALEAVAEKVAASAASFEATAIRIAAALEEAAKATGGALGKGAEEAVQRIAAATEGMRGELVALVSELRESARAASGSLKSGGEQGAQALTSALGSASADMGAALAAAAERIASAGQAAGGALTEGGQAASRSLADAGGAFGGRAEALAERAQTLTRAAEAAAARIGDLEKAAQAAAEPLTTASSQFQTAGSALREVAPALIGAAQQVSAAGEQISGATQRLETVQATAGRLAQSLGGAVERFAGLDKDLASVVKELQAGLQSFAREVGECVVRTDEGLAKAVTQLNHLVNEVLEAVDDLKSPKRPAAHRGG